ncbi:MAG: tetratricopeptide (TPR) repeat protein [Aureispira sp.]|jgi:tetratricopeptide (TPR) repeat protein
MDTNLLNNYVLKAIDAYPYELQETVENLNYALSYENDNAYALYLMGCLQAEQFEDYEKAKQYFAEALANKMDCIKVYPKYILVLIWNHDFDEAQKLIDFTHTVKAVGKGELLVLQASLFECQEAYKKALKTFKKAKLFVYNNSYTSFIESEMNRVKNKLKPKKKKSSKFKKKKNRKQKKNKK